MPKQNQKNEQKFSIFGQSDVGMRCMINSDCIEFDQTKGIAILTDGMKQSEAGKISAKLAARSVFEGLRSDVAHSKRVVSEGGASKQKQRNYS